MEQSGPQQQAEGTGQPPKASSSSCSGGMGAAAPAAVPAADGAPAWRLAQRLLAGLRSLPPHTQSGSPGSQPLAAGPQAWPQEEQPQGQPGAELKEEEEQAALAPPAGDSLSPLGSMLLLPTSSDVAAAPAAVAEAPATAAPAAAAAAAANPREMLAVYSGLRYRYDGSGYHLPWDVRLRIPPRPGDARAPVDICRTATAEEGAVAYDVGCAWRQLHPAAGNGAPPDAAFNFPAARYRQNAALWARIQAVGTVPELRGLLQRMRDGGELLALAQVLQQQIAVTPPSQQQQQLQPQASPPPPQQPDLSSNGGGAGSEADGRGEGAGGETKRCSHCRMVCRLDHWRRHAATGKRLCGACGTFADRHQGQLPDQQLLRQRRQRWREEEQRQEWLKLQQWLKLEQQTAAAAAHPYNAAAAAAATSAGRSSLQQAADAKRRREKPAAAAAVLAPPKQPSLQAASSPSAAALAAAASAAAALLMAACNPASPRAANAVAGTASGSASPAAVGALPPEQPPQQPLPRPPQQRPAEQPLQPQQAQQPQPAPQPQQQQDADLFSLLLGVANTVPAAAAAGLTVALVASFSALLDTLPPPQQAAQEARLRMLLREGLYGAAASGMQTALQLRLARAAQQA